MIPWHWPRHHEIKKDGGNANKTLMPKEGAGGGWSKGESFATG